MHTLGRRRTCGIRCSSAEANSTSDQHLTRVSSCSAQDTAAATTFRRPQTRRTGSPLGRPRTSTSAHRSRTAACVWQGPKQGESSQCLLPRDRTFDRHCAARRSRGTQSTAADAAFGTARPTAVAQRRRVRDAPRTLEIRMCCKSHTAAGQNPCIVNLRCRWILAASSRCLRVRLSLAQNSGLSRSWSYAPSSRKSPTGSERSSRHSEFCWLQPAQLAPSPLQMTTPDRQGSPHSKLTPGARRAR